MYIPQPPPTNSAENRQPYRQSYTPHSIMIHQPAPESCYQWEGLNTDKKTD
jgi:hypothetical protein